MVLTQNKNLKKISLPEINCLKKNLTRKTNIWTKAKQKTDKNWGWGKELFSQSVFFDPENTENPEGGQDECCFIVL